jgi:hypothetical protein
VSTHHARASSGRKSRRDDGRLPSFKRAVSNLQLWCTLNVCMSSVDLHRANFRDHGGEHGQESEEGKEDKEDSQEEKEIIRSMKASEARHAFAIRTGGSFL